MTRRHLAALAALAAASTLVTPAAAATIRWAPARAATVLKVTYRAPDTYRLASYQHDLNVLLAAGTPDTDPRVIGVRSSIVTARTAAVVDTARCVGVGKPVRRRWAKFHCTARLTGEGEYHGDFWQTVKLTVRPTSRTTITVRQGYRYHQRHPARPHRRAGSFDHGLNEPYTRPQTSSRATTT